MKKLLLTTALVAMTAVSAQAVTLGTTADDRTTVNGNLILNPTPGQGGSLNVGNRIAEIEGDIDDLEDATGGISRSDDGTTTTINGGAQISGGGLTIGDQGDFDAGIAGDWQTLTINGNTVNNGDLTTGSITSSGNATFNGVTNNRYLEQRGSATFTGTTNLEGNTTVGTFSDNSDLTVIGNTTTHGNTTTNGLTDTIGLEVDNNTTLGDSANDRTTINGTATVEGRLTVNGTNFAGDDYSYDVGQEIDDLRINNSALTGAVSNQGTRIDHLNGRIDNISTTPGAQGEQGVQGSQGVQGIQGATGAAGADGRDGVDARINVNSAGQYVVSDSSGTSVTVATDEQVTLLKTN